MNQVAGFPPPFADPTAALAPPMWYVGNKDDYIEFGYAIAQSGEVVLTSALTLNSRGVTEPFLVESWRRNEAIEHAITMVKDAKEFLKEDGFKLDGNKSSEQFIKSLRALLGITLQ